MEIILSVKNKQARLALPHHACKFSSVQKLHEYPHGQCTWAGVFSTNKEPKDTQPGWQRTVERKWGLLSQRDPSAAGDKNGKGNA